MRDFIEVNLLPAEYRVHKAQVRLEGWYVWPAVVVGAAAVVMAGFQVTVTSNITIKRNEVAQLEHQIKQLEPIEQEIKKLEAEKKIIVGKIMALERISVNRAKWVRLLEVVCQHLPEYTWLVSLTENAGASPRLTLQGKTRRFPEVATYMADLRQSVFVTAVELTKIEQVDAEANIYAFEIVATIDPNAGLTTVDESETRG